MRIDEQSELPDGWCMSTLAQTAALVKDKVDPKSMPDVPYLGLEHIEAHTMRILGRGRGFDVRSMKTRFSAGDVLYGKLRPYLNKVATPSFDGVCSTDFLVFTESAKLDAAYLANYLNQLWVANQAHQLSNGVSLPRVDWDSLSRLPIAYPENRQLQRAIAREVDTIRRRQATAAAHLTAARQAIGRFRHSVIAMAYSGRLTAHWRRGHAVAGAAAALRDAVESNRRSAIGKRYIASSVDVEELSDIPKEWVWTTPGQLCRPDRALTYGVIKLGSAVPGGVPTLRSSDVRWLRIDESSVKRIDKSVADNYKRTYLEGGEVLVAVRGSRGGVAVATSRMRGWNVSREVAVLPLVSAVHAPYVAYAIGSTQSQQWMEGVAKGVIFVGVNIEDLKRLPIPLPALAEQIEITHRVGRLFAIADDLESRINSVSKRVDRCAQAVLAKAFRGELTFNGAKESNA